jgi:hypothetical protein
MEELQLAIRSEDVKKAAALTAALLPDEKQLRKALKKNIDKETVAKILAFHQQLSQGTTLQIAKLLKVPRERTEVQVHKATGKSIAINKKGSTAYKEFPGGAVKAAKEILQPKMEFYEVECTEPGEERGTKFHLFYNDGKNWKMLGPIWRMGK